MTKISKKRLINCDLGEGEPEPHTLELMRWIDCANIACGVHAGDATRLPYLIEAALRQKVSPGGHPGLPGNFGRADIDTMDSSGFAQLLLPQVKCFIDACKAVGCEMEAIHFKLHGSLYHLTENNVELAQAWLNLFDRLNLRPRLIVKAGGQLQSLALDRGFAVWAEGFLDRAYQDDGSLMPRSHPNALISNTADVLKRLQLLLDEGQIETLCGNRLQMDADTLCLHGDTPNALHILKAVRKQLEKGMVGRLGLEPRTN